MREERKCPKRSIRSNGVSENPIFLYPLTHIGDAFSVGARVVRVEILMNVEDEIVDGTIRIGDLAESIGRPVRDKGLSAGPVVTRHKNQLARSSSLADGRYSSLDRGRPKSDVRTKMCEVRLKTRGETRIYVHVMRLIHKTEDNLGLAGVLGGDLAPKTREV